MRFVIWFRTSSFSVSIDVASRGKIRENRLPPDKKLPRSRSGFTFRGFPRWRAALAVAAALALLPIGVSDASWLSDVFKGDKHDKSHASKRATSVKHAAKPHHVRVAALGPTHLNSTASKPASTGCDPKKWRIVLDVGHTAESEGATSARNVTEFVFNLRLAQRIYDQLKAAGFAETRLLVTEGKARPSLVRRVNAANNMQADMLLSIHHDSVPNSFLEDWEFEGKKSHFSDRFSGYSVFVSNDNPDFKTSLSFAELIAKQLKASGLKYAEQYSQPVMGHYQHPLLNRDTGVYSYDKLIVLKTTRMPAVLLEAGSIVNRDEELKMASPERQDIIAGAVVAATRQFCTPQAVSSGPSR
jgi:N-acetylmuramoyl-L-alanine amidase